MKRCVEEHTVPAFGTIPAGSLWDDDSPFLVEPAKFVDVDAPAKPERVVKKSAPVRKFGEKKGDA